MFYLLMSGADLEFSLCSHESDQLGSIGRGPGDRDSESDSESGTRTRGVAHRRDNAAMQIEVAALPKF